VYSLLFALAAILIATKLFGEFARRLGQPSVLGELLAGIVLGASVLGVVDPRDAAIHAIGQLGLFVLLFQIGLHTDIRALRRVGSSAMSVAVAGVVLPFLGGFAVARLMGVATLPAVIVGASLTATSMAISARVLGDKGILRTREGQVVIGAALADDVIGLILLSVVIAVVANQAIDAAAIAKISAVSIGFIVLALALGNYAVPPLFRAIDGIRAKGSLGMFGLAFGLLLAAIALQVGTSLIIGAFVAGVILHPTAQRQEIERTTAQIGHFFVPIFFAVVGASISVNALLSSSALAMGAALTAVAVAGKIIAGFAQWNFRGNKLLVGVAMVPRGEVGLIFAQMGLATGAIPPELFGAIMLVVVVTTFVTPPLVNVVIARDDSLEREHTQGPDVLAPDGRRATTVGRRH
jgi:Kef-type K+ transport system membrane component KefB